MHVGHGGGGREAVGYAARCACTVVQGVFETLKLILAKFWARNLLILISGGPPRSATVR